MVKPTNKNTSDKKKEPERLSKAGLWLRNNKPGIGEIVDVRAVLK